MKLTVHPAMIPAMPCPMVGSFCAVFSIAGISIWIPDGVRAGIFGLMKKFSWRTRR